MNAGERVLVAGIGNIFFGDDGFGCEAARRLAERPLPDGVVVKDFGIRGLDLAYALLDEREAVILLDAAPLGAEPGTVSVIEPEIGGGLPAAASMPEAHALDPVRVLALARSLGAPPVRTLLVACEPAVLAGGQTEGYEDVLVSLSDPVRAAVDTAIAITEELLWDICDGTGSGTGCRAAAGCGTAAAAGTAATTAGITDNR